MDTCHRNPGAMDRYIAGDRRGRREEFGRFHSRRNSLHMNMRAETTT
jgi:hypothetical protein